MIWLNTCFIILLKAEWTWAAVVGRSCASRRRWLRHRRWRWRRRRRYDCSCSSRGGCPSTYGGGRAVNRPANHLRVQNAGGGRRAVSPPWRWRDDDGIVFTRNAIFFLFFFFFKPIIYNSPTRVKHLFVHKIYYIRNHMRLVVYVYVFINWLQTRRAGTRNCLNAGKRYD